MSVKACNGSDGQDATVEAPGRRLRIGYVGFFHISRALYRRCSASSSPRQLLACPWGAEADRAVDRQRRCSPRLFISAPSPADSHSGIDLATPNLLNHPECPPEARSSPSRAAATARFAADSPLEGSDSNHRSPSRDCRRSERFAQRSWGEVRMSFGETESSMSLPSREDSAPPPKVSVRPTRV
jgi:hypothetical protein